MDRMELMEVNGAYPTPEEVAAELPNFIARAQEIVVKEFERQGFSVPPTLVIAGGRKYIKVSKVDGRNGGQSVYCFVRAVDGAILKPATWKAPALNFTRGNIFDAVLPVGAFGVHY